MICAEDTKGRAVWISTSRAKLSRYSHELTQRGERYRIVPRTVAALGGSTTVWVLVIQPKAAEAPR